MCYFICIRLLQCAEQLLITVDVLAAVCFDARMYGALRSLVSECLREAGKFGKLDIFHGTVCGSEQQRNEVKISGGANVAFADEEEGEMGRRLRVEWREERWGT